MKGTLYGLQNLWRRSRDRVHHNSNCKRRNSRIYTIGVGNKGIVPFGKDYFGTPNLVENTFSDSLFRWSSAITGGQYFWAKDAAAITRALEDILK
jgi:hypothetical protein